ncbi:hypothetical protein V8Z74_02195 [Comamonas sp. w2-DMI]|uniref:Cellulose biosynthesis protein BcsF n=1 Tax=Comamonas terrae TaxID=673548 RepID=A0ABW5UJS3_9BURK|nr:hypothetical protein [Comamonas terrae]
MSSYLFFTGIAAGIAIAAALWLLGRAESASKLLRRWYRPRYLQPYPPAPSARHTGKG